MIGIVYELCMLPGNHVIVAMDRGPPEFVYPVVNLPPHRLRLAWSTQDLLNTSHHSPLTTQDLLNTLVASQAQLQKDIQALIQWMENKNSHESSRA